MFSTGEIYGKLQAMLWHWELGSVKETGLPACGPALWPGALTKPIFLIKRVPCIIAAKPTRAATA